MTSNSSPLIYYCVAEDEALAEVNERLRQYDLEIIPVRDEVIGPRPEFTGLEILAIAGAAVLVAKFITSEIEKSKGGVRIDLGQDGKKMVRRDKNLPYGYVLIYGGGDQARLDIAEQPKDWMDRFLETIIAKVPAGTPNDAAKTAQEMGLERDKVALGGS